MSIRSRCRRSCVALATAAIISVSSLASVRAQEGLQPGEAFLTQFSGTTTDNSVETIDTDGVVGSVIDLRTPGKAPTGARIDAPGGPTVTAGQVGQVFGVAIGGAEIPAVYLAATSAFGLHRTTDNSDWMPGMWGANGGGPSSVYMLDPQKDYAPSILADVVLDGRENTGAGLGNIAYDPWHDQLFVSDLETGMIHRLRTKDGLDLGHYDHGATARPNFTEAATGEEMSLAPVEFDPTSAAHVSDCAEGAFASTPSCWNFADFRRRVFGLGVMQDPLTKDVRLYYSVWGSQAFGNPEYAAAGDEQRNSVWSIGIGDNGDFARGDVRREFFLPDFFSAPQDIARAGRGNPVADIAISTAGDTPVMLLAERGGVRNLGFAESAPFAFPHEARVLRYELGDDGKWQPVGRYDVGQYDRKDDGVPFLRANAAGGVAFGPGYDSKGKVDLDSVDGTVWVTGDGLCSAAGPCVDSKTHKHSDASDVDGLQGVAATKFGEVDPEQASQPYPAQGPATPATGPDSSYVVDADGDTAKSDATEVGDVDVYQPVSAEVEQALTAQYYQAPGDTDLEQDYEPPEELDDTGWDPAPFPPGGNWPDPPPLHFGSDLAIVKTGPATCQKGVVCHYTLKVTNLGAVPYIGLVAIHDTMPTGATLSSSSPGWHCTVSAPNVDCVTLGFASLGVGGTATLELIILLPAVIPTPTVKNCGTIDWFEMGTDDGPGDTNDKSCIDTPVTGGFDLGIEKTSSTATCVAGADCIFVIKVTNHGPGTFTGNLVLKDTLPPSTSFVSGTNCSIGSGGPACEKDGITMAANASRLFIVILKPSIIMVGQNIQNCVDIDWSRMGADDGTPDVFPDHACATVPIKPFAGFHDLTITKAGPAHCSAGGHCTYTVTYTNNGPDDYNGLVQFFDIMPPGATWFSSGPSLFACNPVFPGLFTCFVPGSPTLLPAGASIAVAVTIQLPNPIPGGAKTVHNCVFLSNGFDKPAPPVNAPNDACSDTNIGAGFDLAAAKTGPTACYEGKICDYLVSIVNNGPAPFVGSAAFKDLIPPGSTVDSTSGAIMCQKIGPNEICTLGTMTIPPFTVKGVHIRVRLPNPVVGPTVKNCVTLDWSDPFPFFGAPVFTGDDKPANDGPFCITTPVLAADLAPFGGTVCELGQPCTLNVTIDNRGGRVFKGAAGLRGTLLPAVHIASATSMTPGLDCTVDRRGRLRMQRR